VRGRTEEAIHTSRVVTDSSCDLPKGLLDRRGITVVPLTVDVGGQTFQEGVDITPREFYDRMARSTELPKTSQPSPAAFQDTFDALADSGPVVCLTISSKLSGTYQSACLARDLSGRGVTVFDSLTGSLGLGLQVLRACDVLDEGRSAGEVVEELTRYRGQMNTLILLNTLENIVKGGRLSKFQGAVSKVLDIRVLLHDMEGAVEVLERVHGHRRLLEAAVKQVASRRPDLSDRAVGITHFNNSTDAEWLAQALRERFHPRGVIVNDMGPTMATYAGEGGMILSF
jgi:DegV family protein with EDD domain